MQVKYIPVPDPLDGGMILYVILEDESVNETTRLAYTLQAHQDCWVRCERYRG